MRVSRVSVVLCFLVNWVHALEEVEICTKPKPIGRKGYASKCGIIRSCKSEAHPIPDDCTKYLECDGNKTRECTCAAGNYFVTELGTCTASADRFACTCPPLQTVLPPTRAPPTTEPGVTVIMSSTIDPTAGETTDGLSPTALYIIGSAAGGVVIIILLVVVIVLCCRMRRARLDKNITIVENPEYTKRSSGIYAEIEDPVPSSADTQINRFSTFQPTSPRSPTGAATSASIPEVDDSAHEYQQLLGTHRTDTNNACGPVQRSESQEQHYMVTALVGGNKAPDNTPDSNAIPLETIPAEGANGHDNPDSPSKHEYFVLEVA